MEEKGMRPIWFFVGLAMIVMGGIILASGIYYLINGEKVVTPVSHLKPNIWWGAFMLIVGILFVSLLSKRLKSE